MNNNPEVYEHTERNENPDIKMGAATLKSIKHEYNEDAAFMSSDSKSPLKVFAIFDGMGGHKGGADASSTALHTVSNRIENGNINPNLSLEQTEGLVKSLILEAHSAIKNKAIGDLKDMGTTASLGILWEGKNEEKKLVVGNVGDSRIYIFREGKLIQLTTDDDLAEIGRGNVLTQAVGQKDIDPKVGIFDILPDDQVIGISDGISDALGEDIEKEFLKALQDNKGNPTEAANSLVKKAREYSLGGKKMDDQTALVVDILNNSDTTVEKNDRTQTEPEAEKPYRLIPGTMIRIERSDGSVDDDWFIIKRDGNRLMVRNSSGLTKMVTAEDVDKLNPPIEKVKSWDELIFAINQLDENIEGSNKNYDKDEMVHLIESVRKGEIPPTSITRNKGIREKVMQLAAIDKSRSELKTFANG